MTLTACICHGFGVFLYLADEGMPTGASWTIEVAPCIMSFCGLQSAKAMKSIDKAWALAQARNEPFPQEFLVLIDSGS